VKILVCQITRMGDVLQTSPLFRVLKRKYPDSRITVLVRPMGKPIAERIPEIDEILIYEEDPIFRDLQSNDSDRLLRAYERVDDYVQRLRAAQYDVVYNCSHSIGSAILLKMVGIPRIIGADYSDDWRFLIRGPWSNYFFTGVFTREFNDLNLCDVSQLYEPEPGPRSDLVFELRDADRESAQRLLAENGIGPDDRMICFQLGASDDVSGKCGDENVHGQLLPYNYKESFVQNPGTMGLKMTQYR